MTARRSKVAAFQEKLDAAVPARSSLHLKLSTSPPPPLSERGRMLFIPDIREMTGRTPDGNYRYGIRWIRSSFAPEYKRKLGRDPYWWQADAVRWLAEQRGTR